METPFAVYDALSAISVPPEKIRVVVQSLERDMALFATSRQFNQLDKFSGSRFDLLHSDMDRRFEQVAQRFAQIDQRFEQIDKRFDQIDQRFAQVDRRFAQVDQRFDQIDQRLERVDKRIESLGAEVADLREQMTQQFGEVHRAAGERYSRLSAEMRQMQQQISRDVLLKLGGALVGALIASETVLRLVLR
jgi:septal ring factor EnvC (AmiA/AmiB activator)